MFTEYSINGHWFILFLTLIILVYLAIEMWCHRKRLEAIKYRIHVNGTRGKSSVARLIGAGLRGGNVKTVCKTTGTMARYIDTTGNETPIIRIGRTNIIEQVKVIKKASLEKPLALVIECMAVQPLLQSLCELKLVRATHGVLCNARADHLDVMGPTETDVALALAGTMPVNGIFITPEKKYLPVFTYAAKDRGTRVVSVDTDEINQITDAEMEAFSYLEYKENVALALSVCQSCGVDRQAALKGMWTATPDPGALIVKTILFQDKFITLANGFAANDPESTEQLWQKVIDKFPKLTTIVGLVNCRDDRADRSKQMAESSTRWCRKTHLMAIGSGIDCFTKTFSKTANIKLIQAEGCSAKEVLEQLVQLTGDKHILAIGVGNIAAIGFELLNYFCSQESVTYD